MRTTRIELQPVEVVAEITCDCCGEKIHLHPTEQGGLEGIRISAVGGYGSHYLGDGGEVDVDVCERCLVEWVTTFKPTPKRS